MPPTRLTLDIPTSTDPIGITFDTVNLSVTWTPPAVRPAAPGPDRWKIRSRTHTGPADAMAAQWFNPLTITEAT